MDAAGIRSHLALNAAALRRAWLLAIQRLRAANPIEQLAARLRTADPVVGLDVAIGTFATAERTAFTSTAAATTADAAHQLDRALVSRRVSKRTLGFDPEDPDVMTWAERNRLDLIQGLDLESRSLIRYALSVAQETGENPRVTARQIRDAIGLTEKQERWVRNYRAQLERGQYAAALARRLSSGASDRTIASARDRGLDLTPAQIDAAVDRYRANLIAYRAEVIARTESLRITHQAGDAAYRQAIARGALTLDQLECSWLATRDPRTRDTHAAMNGQIRDWGDPFESPSGALLLYPGDPSAPVEETACCRCCRVVRVRPAAEARAA